jgi:hypothetical protein
VGCREFVNHENFKVSFSCQEDPLCGFCVGGKLVTLHLGGDFGDLEHHPFMGEYSVLFPVLKSHLCVEATVFKEMLLPYR